MQSTIEQAVDRVIVTMRRNLSEQLTVDDMARAAMFSKFHFTRIFQRVTGVSPGRFLSAIRLQEAKELLVTTNLNVADISMRVGYNSVGTFSTRFTRSVGLSPTAYRRMRGFAEQIATRPASARATGAVHGRLHLPPQYQESCMIFMGLFPTRIPEERPVSCAVLDRPGPFRLTNVPDGTWYLLCHSVSGRPRQAAQEHVTVATVGPITTAAHLTTTANVVMQPVSQLDPPVLLALLDTRTAALDRLAAVELAPAA